jgi:hypothetical protein
MKSKSKIPKFKLPFTDVECVQRIKRLPKSHQPIIARVVWWDFFGLCLTKNRTTAFDEWMIPATQDEPDWNVLVKSLMKIGYPDYLAIKRLQPKAISKKKKKND